MFSRAGSTRVGNSDNRANLAQSQLKLPTEAELGKMATLTSLRALVQTKGFCSYKFCS
jgi:hypothetical protein